MFNPVPSGRFTDGFGWRTWADGSRDFHTGQDIAASGGTPILAAHSGVVLNKWFDRYADGRGAGGNMISLRGDDGYETRYAHMIAQSPLAVGQRVVGGQTALGGVGATGAATGNHLHFEVLQNGQYRDPYPFITGGGGVGDDMTPQEHEWLSAVFAGMYGPQNVGAQELRWASLSGPQKAFYGNLEIDIYTQQLVAQTLSGVSVMKGQVEALLEAVKQLAGGGGQIDMKLIEAAAERGAREAYEASLANTVLVPVLKEE